MPTITLETPYLYLPLSYRPSPVVRLLGRRISESAEHQPNPSTVNEHTKKNA